MTLLLSDALRQEQPEVDRSPVRGEPMIAHGDVVNTGSPGGRLLDGLRVHHAVGIEKVGQVCPAHAEHVARHGQPR